MTESVDSSAFYVGSYLEIELGCQNDFPGTEWITGCMSVSEIRIVEVQFDQDIDIIKFEFSKIILTPLYYITKE